MFNSYEEACEAEVTREEARQEILRHYPSDEIVEEGPDGYVVKGAFDTFLLEVGDKEEYLGEEVLGWLGY